MEKITVKSAATNSKLNEELRAETSKDFTFGPRGLLAAFAYAEEARKDIIDACGNLANPRVTVHLRDRTLTLSDIRYELCDMDMRQAAARADGDRVPSMTAMARDYLAAL